MEAPEKIWMTDDWVWQFDDKDFMGEDSIEYTRTDAFIEKAENFLYEKLNSGKMECGDITVFIEKFRNYMKR